MKTIRFDHRITSDRPAAIQAVELLREAILHAELRPGRRLSEQEISGAMGLSRQPVREAFIRLAGEGLLEIRPQRGTFVSRISTQDVLDSRFVREAVEADLARRATRHADEGLIGELAALLRRQEEAVGADPSNFMQLDEAFHRALAAAAGKAQVWLYIQKLKSQMDRVRYLVAADMPREALIAQHRDIVEAVAARDEDRAEAAMRAHMRQLLDDLPKIVASYPDYFLAAPADERRAEELEERFEGGRAS
ncbi:MAG: GntR family transcriptional regulator [Paracoccaceae bacterium]